MVAPLPVTANARSVALQLQPDAVLQAGSLLNLTTSPEASATARTVQGTDPTAALATARGIGAGYSHYYSGLADEAFFQSPNLSIHSGGGSISGDALATAFSTGRGDTAATAQATNIGLANVSYLDRYGGALRIGTSAAPFTAKAVAGSSSILDAIAGSTLERLGTSGWGKENRKSPKLASPMCLSCCRQSSREISAPDATCPSSSYTCFLRYSSIVNKGARAQASTPYTPASTLASSSALTTLPCSAKPSIWSKLR